METHRRKADGRRVFTPQFKQEQVARLGRQELTVSELARELVVAPQLIKQWQRLSTEGSTAAVTTNDDVVPASESIYTALDTMCTADRLGLVPITTPAASPQSHGMSEAFVNTIKRHYVAGADRSSAASILAQIPAWIADYNAVAPHSALGY